jgi:hypothetical protein
MQPPIVFADANVLYAAPLRDLLLQLAGMAVIGLRWSQTVQAEWMRALLIARPELGPERLKRTQTLMAEHLPDARFVTLQRSSTPLFCPIQVTGMWLPPQQPATPT